MTARTRLVLRVGAAIGASLVVLVIAAALVLQSSWFAKFVREKIITATEEATGARVELGSFQFDWSHLTVRIRNFVLHGTEPAGAAPLARVALLELRLKLLSGLTKAVDIRYLGIDTPQVNVIVFPDGKTNIPEPKVKSKSTSNTSELETVVNLAVAEFRIDRGLLQFAQQKTAFGVRGENLAVLLNYNILKPSYQGRVSLDPVVVSSKANPPLRVHVNLPLTIEKDAVRLANGRIFTDASQLQLTGSLENLKDPRIAAQLNASVSLPEIARSFSLPINTRSSRLPKTLTAQASVQVVGQDVIEVRSADLALGQTTVHAAGTLDPRTQSAIRFQTNFALGELASLFQVNGVQASGALQANGSAKLDGQKNYAVDGHLESAGLRVRSGTTDLRELSLSSPFHADPYLISLDGLRVGALGGSVNAKISVEKLQTVSVQAGLRGFSIPTVVAALAGHPLGYDGTLGGTIQARGDLNAKGTAGYTAQADLAITPGSRGVPVSGNITGDYNGARDSIDLGRSYLQLPNSRLDLDGRINQQLNIALASRNLNDFLPAANFGSPKPMATLPVVLQGGAAHLDVQVRGKLAAPLVQSHAAIDRFAVEGRAFDRLSLDLNAAPDGAQISHGVLSRHGLQTAFDALLGLQKWNPRPQSNLAANVTIRNGDIADLLALAGESSLPLSGKLNGDVHVNGTYGNPLGSANLQIVEARAYDQPIDHLYTSVQLADQLITLNNLELAAAQGHLNASGTFRHPRDSFELGHVDLHLRSTNIQLGNFQALQQRSPGVDGAIQLAADLAGDLRKYREQSEFVVANVNADVSARGLKVRNQSAGDLTATVRTAGRDVNYQLASDFAASDIKVSGRTTLAPSYPTIADASVRNLTIEKVLEITGQNTIPASGTLTADGHFSGTAAAPDAMLQFALSKANVYTEPINRLLGKVHYTNTSIDVPSIELQIPAGNVGLHGSFIHPANSFDSGSLALKLDSSDLQVAKIQHAEQAKPGLAGVVKLAADVAGTLRQQNGKSAMLFSRLNADASATALRVGELSLGDASLQTRTNGNDLSFRLDSNLAKSQIHGSGTAQLTGDYPTRASVTFSNIRYANLAPFIQADYVQPPSVDALVEGSASVNGPILQTDSLNAMLQLDRLEIKSVPRSSPTGAPPVRTVDFHNQGPIQIALDRNAIQVRHFDIEGPKTSITASGGMNLKDDRSPLAINLAGNADLAVLQDTSRDFYSSGNILLNTVVRGTLSQPLLNGRIQLKNANVNYTDSPNGLSNANGVILLNGTSATIQNLTGESGGGKVALSGFAGLTGRDVTFNVRANATRVRVRYSGVSVTSDADVSLIGNLRRSLASGLITIHKIGYGSSSDAGSFLSTASTPASTPTAPSPLLAGMRLDVRIVTGPDLRVVTTYADRLAIEANLAVRGTAATPGMLGRVSITDGQLVFFGNQYNVNTGTVNFYNPTAIQPVVNFSLETIAQNVDVVLGVTGPISNLALTYRSDPPLTFQQIVSLLATNTTPSDPTIAAHQPTPPQQSLAQMGSSAVLSQAVANPLASRVQRVFGLSSFKIDPSVAGTNGQPSAKVTLQQKIASNVTFTYITDVTQTNSQVIRVEWAFTPKLSAVGLRDFNGNVSVQFYYKFKVQ